MKKPVRLLFLDIDSTVRHGTKELGRPVSAPEEVVVYPDALEMIRQYRAIGWRVVGVTNQGRVALGELTAENAVAALGETNRQCGQMFDLILACFHHPDAKDPLMAHCFCRKPKYGNLVQATLTLAARFPDEFYPIQQALMVGDQESDKACAEQAGISFMWADAWRAQAELFKPKPAPVVEPLPEVKAVVKTSKKKARPKAKANPDRAVKKLKKR